MALWEQLALGAFMLFVIFWFKPGIKAAFERSQKAEKDWPGLLLPLAAVVLFVMFLIATV